MVVATRCPHGIAFACESASLCVPPGWLSPCSGFLGVGAPSRKKVPKGFALSRSKMKVSCIVGSSSLMPIPEEGKNGGGFYDKGSNGDASAKGGRKAQTNQRMRKEAFSKQKSSSSLTGGNAQTDRNVWRRLPLTKRPDYSSDLKLIEKNERGNEQRPGENFDDFRNDPIHDRVIDSSIMSNSDPSVEDVEPVNGMVSVTLPSRTSKLRLSQPKQQGSGSPSDLQHLIETSLRKVKEEDPLGSADSKTFFPFQAPSASPYYPNQNESRNSSHEFASTSSPSPSDASFNSRPNGASVSMDSVESIRTALISALESRKTDAAWGLLQSLKCKGGLPCDRSLSRLVAQLCHRKEFKKSFSLYTQFHGKFGLLLDEDAFGLLVLTASKSGHLKESVNLLDAMVLCGYRPRVSIWSSVVSQLSKSSDMAHLALEIFEKFLSQSNEPNCPMRPDCGAFNAALNAAVTIADLRKAEHLLRVLMPSMGVTPDFRSYNILIKGYAIAGFPNKMFDLIKDMKKAGISPDVSTYNSLVCAYVGFDDIQEAEFIVQEMKSMPASCRPNVRTYSGLINGYVKRNQLDKARMIVEEMLKSSDCFPNEYSFSNLLNGYVKTESMELASIIFETMRSKNIAMNSVTYNTMLSGYCKLNQIEKALQLYEQMKKDGINPTVITFNILIDGCALCNDVKSASEIFCHMSTIGISPSVATYTTLIKALGAVDQPQLAYRVFEEMIRENSDVEADLSAWNAMIHCYVRCGMMQEAKALFKKLKLSGLIPNLSTYGSLVKGYLHQNLASEALVIWREIKDRLSAQGDKKNEGIKNRWKSKGLDDGFLEVDESLLDDLVHICVKAGYFQRAMEIVSFMEKLGISANRLKYKKMFIELEYSYSLDSSPSNRSGSAKPSLQRQGLEAFKFWLGLPNKYYSRDWDWHGEE